ncbi:MAG: aminotransferase class I/II-fold pyridoxal phosphate-dependent enzyme [Ruminococcaceae bacterium]|nr:aminotransferase class I/II-fold pyridoxal phosphate-dependent enzyme [Oscillospiraceae bacterium]
MKKLIDFTKDELIALKADLEKQYAEYKAQNLSLDMSRGKPSKAQLDISNGLLDILSAEEYERIAPSFDYRNYGILLGIPECRKLFAEILQVEEKNVIIGGTASLTLMFDFIAQCVASGIGGCEPWARQGKVKFLCPVPGYDRHFGICEYFGIEMINIPMDGEGPDMDMIEELIKDESVKGMFCVPKYSNPTGITYSDAVVARIARMKPAAKDFRIIWDNAYCIHDLTDTPDSLLNIFDELKKYGNEDMVVEFCSTSKITFPGAGVSALAASDNNIKEIQNRMNFQTISHDKLNQLRHVRFFDGKAENVIAYMQEHRRLMEPKFNAVCDSFEKEFSALGIASWHKPNGGYFISLDVMPGTAKRVGELCKEAGVVLTTVGATFPYGKDPEDKNIRIAPSLPPVSELMTATALLCICVKLAACEKLLG